SGATKHPSARPDAAEHFRLIADADLAQFNPSSENSRQIFDQFPEIDPAVGGEIKNHFIPVKRILHVNQFHFQLMGSDFFQANLKGFLGGFSIFFHNDAIFIVSDAQN